MDLGQTDGRLAKVKTYWRLGFKHSRYDHSPTKLTPEIHANCIFKKKKLGSTLRAFDLQLDQQTALKTGDNYARKS